MNRLSFSQAAFAVLCLAGAAFPLHAQEAPRHIVFNQSSDEPYALVREGARTTFVGAHQRNDDEVEALRKQYPGNFVWFRQAGKAYVVRDPATVAKVAALWARTDQLGLEMKKLEGPMHEKSAAMQALSKKMVAAQGERADTEAVGKQMNELGKSMNVLGKQMGARGKQIENETKQADAGSREIMRDAVRSGAAQPVDSSSNVANH